MAIQIIRDTFWPILDHLPHVSFGDTDALGVRGIFLLLGVHGAKNGKNPWVHDGQDVREGWVCTAVEAMVRQ